MLKENNYNNIDQIKTINNIESLYKREYPSKSPTPQSYFTVKNSVNDLSQ
jgi:hypothetical protein